MVEEDDLAGCARGESGPGSLRALFAALKGWQETAPETAIRWWERAKFIHEHQGWTYRDYDDASAGDILLDQEYLSMMAGLHGKSSG